MEESSRYDAVLVDGRRVRAARLAVRPHLTQKAVAARAGCSRGYVSQIESSGSASVSRETAKGLATALELSLSDLAASEPAQTGSRREQRTSRGRGFAFGAGFDLRGGNKSEQIEKILEVLRELERLLLELLNEEKSR